MATPIPAIVVLGLPGVIGSREWGIWLTKVGGWLSLSNVPGLINTARTIQVTAPNPPPNWEQYYRVATPAVP